MTTATSCPAQLADRTAAKDLGMLAAIACPFRRRQAAGWPLTGKLKPQSPGINL